LTARPAQRNTARARSELGGSPRVPFEQSLRETLDALRAPG
jgi:nucleoside-diphosphate-sugar epimerase